MTQVNSNSRRKFIGTLAAGATAGFSFLSDPAGALTLQQVTSPTSTGSNEVDAMLKSVGKMNHPVAYDVSQANYWGIVWSNVYYWTNEETGTAPEDLGVINIIRHHGVILSLKDEMIKKYKLGEVFGYNDPKTNKPALRNPVYVPEEGDLPDPRLVGIKGLQEKGTKFCACNMAFQVYSGMAAEKLGLKAEDVYNDWVANKLPDIELAPSGVWALGRLSENGIAYIDASVG